MVFCTEHSSKVGLCGCSDFLALWCSDTCPPSPPEGRATLPCPMLLDGTFAATQQERQQRWGDFFAEQEAGALISPEQYRAGLARQKALAVGRRDGSAVFAWEDVPDLASVERLILAARTRKAAGYDGITVEMPRAARYLFPLFAKAATAPHEPVAFRGGGLMVLAKKAGATFQCEDYRSILLACSSGKLYRKFLRGRLGQVLQRVRTELQCGATPGCGIEALSLLARTIQHRAQAARCSWAMILFDIRSAFYRVIRQLVVDVPDTDEGLLNIIGTLGLPGDAVTELHSKLRSVTALAEARASDHISALVSDVLTGTYFRLDHSDLLYLTRRGSRPGDPFADVLFAFLLSAFTRQVDSELERAGLAEAMPPLRTALCCENSRCRRL